MSLTAPKPNRIDQLEDGVRVVRYPSGSVKWRGDCTVCQSYEHRNPLTGLFPDHDPMPRCQSGGRNHCTCDGCF